MCQSDQKPLQLIAKQLLQPPRCNTAIALHNLLSKHLATHPPNPQGCAAISSVNRGHQLFCYCGIKV